MSDLISRSDLYMNDLIRRKDVLALFSTNDCSDKMIGLYERVLDIPTAYDVEKVVAKLEEELKLAEKQKEECVFKALPYYERTEGYIVAISNAIDIVRKGGVE